MDLNDLNMPIMTSLFADVIDTLRENIKRVKAGAVPIGGGVITGNVTIDGTETVTGKITAQGDQDVAGYLRATGTGAMRVPVGTTAQRPAVPVAGDVRFNSTQNAFEVFGGASWATSADDAIAYAIALG